jgi:hypothetical protein
MSKLPHHLTDEELLASLENAESISTDIEWTNDIPQFLSHFKINQGEYAIKRKLLYQLYLTYSNAPLSMYSFTTEITQFLTTAGEQYYKSDIKPEEVLKIIKKDKDKHSNKVGTNLGIRKRFESFVEKIELKKGKDLIPAYYIYEIYRCWAIDNNIKARISHRNFVTLCSLYFEKQLRYHTEGAIFIKIDKEILYRKGHKTIMYHLKQRIKKQKELSKCQRRKKPVGRV